jgi:5'-deoxynucleotidase YfbR-like HD superfamily hydrolase
MNTCREAFERIALKLMFHDTSESTRQDHWQTWQEAWEEATRVERERCIELARRYEYSPAETHCAAILGEIK